MHVNGTKRGGTNLILSNRNSYFSCKAEHFASVWTSGLVCLCVKCVTVCHLDYSNLSLNLCTYVINFIN